MNTLRKKNTLSLVFVISLLAVLDAKSADRDYSDKRSEAIFKCLGHQSQLSIVPGTNPIRYTCTVLRGLIDYKTATSCLRIAGVGYSLTRRSGKWQCCGRNPTGETCVNFADKIGPVTVGICPRGYKAVNASEKSKLCQRRIRVRQFTDPTVVITETR